MKTSLLVLLLPVVAAAHPLGNVTTNRYAALELTPTAILVHHVVDLAELPALRAIAAADRDGDGTLDAREADAWAAATAEIVRAGLRLAVDGAPLALDVVGRVAQPLPGAAGLQTLRLETELRAPLAAARGIVTLDDLTFDGRPGWREIVATGRDGVVLTASTVPATDRTQALRTYPADLLASPLQVSSARVAFAPGAAAVAPTAESVPAPRAGAERFGDRLTALMRDDTPLTASVVVSALMLAVALGALHALSPGHGKTIVGAYLVGSRGTAAHAALLGGVVTATHTAGVYLLGLATLAASQWVVPERLLPWLGVASGLLVVAVGCSLVLERLGAAGHGHTHDDGHHHHHPGGTRHHHHGDHAHHHLPPPGEEVTLRRLVALGVSGGLAPCPSALVVMLGAIAIGRTAFGLALVAAFSLGLAGVLTGIGLVLVRARHLFDHLPLDGRIARWAPVASAVVVSLAGLAVLLDAITRLGA